MGSSARLLGDHYFPITFLRGCSCLPCLVLLIITLLFNYHHLAVSAASPPSPSFFKGPQFPDLSLGGGGGLGGEAPSGEDVAFYQTCEKTIAQQLDTFADNELTKETKLTRVKRGNGTSYFYPFGKVTVGKHLFAWTAPGRKERESGDSNAIVIGAGLRDDRVTPFGWMNGAFIALRKCNATLKANQTHFFAMVVYARKDEDEVVLEWDRLSSPMGRAVEGRRAAYKALDIEMSINQKALLCAYGTCACKACRTCRADDDDDDDDEDEGGGGNGESLQKKMGQVGGDMLKKAGEFLAPGGGKEKPVKPPNTNGAYAQAISKGQGLSKASAMSRRGSATSLSSGSKGDSISAAKGEADAVAETNTDKGKARSMSMSNHGYAQSSSQNSGSGDVQSIAAKSGKSKDYHNYDDVEVDKEEEFDAENLFSETDQAFDQAEQRSAYTKGASKGDGGPDQCSKEMDMVNTMDHAELSNANKDSGKDKEQIRKQVFYRDPLRFGWDVDGGVNRSVSLSGNMSGFAVKRDKCCELKPNQENSDIKKLLDDFDQDCAGLLQEQVGRLEKFKLEQISKLMQTKKLSPTQHRDIVPMILLKVYREQEDLQNAIASIIDVFGNTTGEKVSTSAALLVNAAYYAINSVQTHKIKILRGLAENAQSVWTGVLLEYKKCSPKNGKSKKKCSADYKERLENEMNLALGTYLFLKYADSRFSAGDTSDPADTLVTFLHMHNFNIAKQVQCKSKRALGSNK